MLEYSGLIKTLILLLHIQVSNISECSEHTVNSALPNSTATWTNLQEEFDRTTANLHNERPHTISSCKSY